MLNLSIIVERLQDIMFENKTDVRTLANKIKISSSILYRCLRGEGLLQTSHFIKIAECFNCSLDFLFGIETELNHENFSMQSTFGDRLKKIYIEKNLTEYQVQKATNISRSSLHDWRYNKRLPTIENLVILANYFNCSIDYLVGRE